MATIYTNGEKVKHSDEIPFFVIITKTAQGKEFVWGETDNAQRVERIMKGEHWAFPKGKFVRVEKFENRKAANASRPR